MNDIAVLDNDLPPVSDTDVAKLASQINLADPALSITYGAESMTAIAKFADSLLSNVKAKDAGTVGQDLTNLMVSVKSLNLDSFGQKSVMEKIPLIGTLFNSTRRTMAQFKTLSEQVEEIGGKLENSMVGLLKDIQVLEQLYEHNKDFYQDLSVFIEAGKRKVQQAREVELPKLQEEVANSPDGMAGQRVKDFAEGINRFERRLHDLQMSRTITVQTAPQIRLIQNNNQMLAEKIQTSILSTIPIWKSQMVLALSLQSQKSAAELQGMVANTTNDMLKKNAEMLETSTIETARQVERSIVDVETLKEVQGRLVHSIEETLNIAQEGRERRITVEKELALMENELKNRLTSLASSAVNKSIEAAKGQPAIEQQAQGEE